MEESTQYRVLITKFTSNISFGFSWSKPSHELAIFLFCIEIRISFGRCDKFIKFESE